MATDDPQGPPEEEIFFDRSRRVQDWTCPRSRFWGYEYDGIGVSPASRALYFDVGDVVHKALAALSLGEVLEDVLPRELSRFRLLIAALPSEKIEEQVCLVEGLVRGWYKVVLPRLLRDYNVLAVEEEFTYRFDARAAEVERPPWMQRRFVTMGVTPDRLLERRSDQTLWYRETKTSSYFGKDWAAQWTKAIQLHTTAFIVGKHLQREVQGVIVEGLFKGAVREDKSTSIFAYGYTRGVGGVVGYHYIPGSRKVPVWTLPGGIGRWVTEMPEEILENQFIEAPPVFLQTRMVEAFLRQAYERELDIYDTMEHFAAKTPADKQSALDVWFPQSFNACQPAIGSKCAWSDCCWNPFVSADPVASGLYVRRQPHHRTDPKYQGGDVPLGAGVWAVVEEE